MELDVEYLSDVDNGIIAFLEDVTRPVTCTYTVEVTPGPTPEPIILDNLEIRKRAKLETMTGDPLGKWKDN